jgi:hypothetical protein
MTSPTSAAQYVVGHPPRGASASPSTPPALQRCPQRRTTATATPTAAAMAGTRVRERAKRITSCSSPGDRRRTWTNVGTGHLLGCSP